MNMDVYAGLMFLVALSFLLITFGCQQDGSCPSGAKPDPHGSESPAVGHESPPTVEHINRLAAQSSLYLLLHANNPVDWYPWGEEALSKAKAERKLIFLSVGYSSCYWCHVMERESFMDEEVAAILNEHFVCIKVDREERPDIDQVYMTALQVYYQLTGSPRGGGWPLTMFLTPDGRPILGGTYYPPRDKPGMTGLITVLRAVENAWEASPEKLIENADIVSSLVKRQLQQQMSEPLDPNWIKQPWAKHADKVLEALTDRFDADYGGFGYSPANPHTPKFPEPSNLEFLLEYARQSDDDDEAEAMLETTLLRMAEGGIRDHLGGGFHRYSTDRFWAIPHFEKMLYDNGQLASAYTEAYLLTGNEVFARVAAEILDFVLSEMVTPEGGFASAIDAETDGKEGLYYAWESEELKALLRDEQFDLLAQAYGVSEQGNFEGRHVLLLPRPLDETAEFFQVSEEELRNQLKPILKTLHEARAHRRRPRTDTKILTAWNGLMIRGLADGARALDDPRYLQAAAKAAEFALGNLRDDKGRLLRTFAGQDQLGAYLDDYAFLVDGLIALHKADGDRRWLEEAEKLTDLQIELFWDERHGGFFFTATDHEKLIARSKDPVDSVLPSGNAVSVSNLIYLAAALDKPDYLRRAEETVATFATQMIRTPAAMPRMAVSLGALLKSREE
jgi:uncharacterized protein YyaL (SSP411 family)